MTWAGILSAVDAARSYRLRTFLQCLGVAIGGASVALTLGLLAGTNRRLEERLLAEGGLGTIYVRPRVDEALPPAERGKPWFGYADVAAIERATQGLVVDVAPIADLRGRLAVKTPEAADLVATTPGMARLEGLEVARGRFLLDADVAAASPVIVLGSTVAARLFGADDAVGRRVELYQGAVADRSSETTDLAGVREAMRDARPPSDRAGATPYLVVGVLARKVVYRPGYGDNIAEHFNERAYLPVTAAITRERGTPELAEIVLRVPGFDDVREARDAIAATLARLRPGRMDWDVASVLDEAQEWEVTFAGFGVAFGLAGAISLLIGGAIIMNLQLASLTQRTREIGLRKALGASGFSIFVAFAVEGMLVATLGGLGGVALSRLGQDFMSVVLELPVYVSVEVAAASVATAAFVGFAFACLPAIRAARLSPVVALRDE